MAKPGWRYIVVLSLLACLTITVVGCGTPGMPSGKTEGAKTSSDGWQASNQTVPVEFIAPLVLEAVKVDSLPAIDGDIDPIWGQAPALQAGALTMKAVYTEKELALLMFWPDRTMSINTPGNWNYFAEENKWYHNDELVNWTFFRPPTRQRQPEWLAMGWDISIGQEFAATGCGGFCHKSPVDGKMHHATARRGEYADFWMLMGRHGFKSGGKEDYIEDMGWLLGGVSQQGPVVFDHADKMDPRQPIAGTFYFRGYAVDGIIASYNDAKFSYAAVTEGNQYCSQCHNIEWRGAMPMDKIPARTFLDEGKIPFYRNWNKEHTAPLYVKKNPVSFIDAMTITQEEIDNGQAVMVSNLTLKELKEIWSRYEQLNAVVPELILKEPSGSAANVRVGAKWSNGWWYLECKRALKTGHWDDIQFDDLTKNYHFTISLSSNSNTLSPLFSDKAAILRFKPRS
ncbi:Ethylbenzene dehydrogenase [Neomoorella glycerini]|uniref:Ethylbenzene dehydrogenase n=1 Tax=Neomoorella glycerini TaxID=55779 RepID=A0A6I5ZMA9_9FIRM|nr:ethylbenzene dehydrogenase-related protein [Moorella glycerini]QGP91014.1 Ethylbenzene dehydrogenase [Moorella glycerini]